MTNDKSFNSFLASSQFLITGKIPVAELKAVGYPAPIVDHQKRQRLFKERYSQQKDQD